jgi:membrane-bound inhibitor of C-type lysozyme
MATTLSNTLAACALALAAAGLCAAPAASAAPESNHPKAEKVLKAKAKKTKKAAAAAAAGAAGATAAGESEPDITNAVTVEYDCELGNKITIYQNDKNNESIALRWKKRLHRMTRVGTTTGALRFENPTFGLVWIGIPAKGMLLDSKLNRQLANECKNAEQAKPVVVATTEDKKV